MRQVLFVVVLLALFAALVSADSNNYYYPFGYETAATEENHVVLDQQEQFESPAVLDNHQTASFKDADMEDGFYDDAAETQNFQTFMQSHFTSVKPVPVPAATTLAFDEFEATNVQAFD